MSSEIFTTHSQWLNYCERCEEESCVMTECAFVEGIKAGRHYYSENSRKINQALEILNRPYPELTNIVYREEFNKCVTDLGISRTGYTPQYFNEGFVRKIWVVAEQTLIKDNLDLRTKIERALAELKKEYQCEDGSDCSRINVLRAIKVLEE